MPLPQNPTTTSGVVVVSGSHGFDRALSDYPSILHLQANTTFLNQHVVKTLTSPLSILNDYSGYVVDTLLTHEISIKKPVVQGVIIDIEDDIEIFLQNPPTTSGVVVARMGFGLGIIFVVPVVGNVRLFPVTPAEFPEQDRRIYPVLPQFSTIIPGG